jgi:thioredoxin reductase
MAVDTPARIAVLGAGPIGLETALYARCLGYDVDVYERDAVAAHVLRWGHVRMFSPFGRNRSPLGLAALRAQDEDYQPPGDEELLTGRGWVERYLLPLSQTDLLSDHLRLGTEVLGVSRRDLLKGELPGGQGRDESEFVLLVRQEDVERYETAEVVIDTTGTLAQPCSLGPGGLPALGEAAVREEIDWVCPDVQGAAGERFAGNQTLVVGSGYSAATTIVALAALADEAAGTHVTWVTRRPSDAQRDGPLLRIAADRLPERDRLAETANALAGGGDDPRVCWLPGTSVESVERTEAGRFNVRLAGQHAGEHEFDRIVGHVGYRPDNTIYRELQVHECYASEGPMKLAAALLGATSGDCLDALSPGPQTLLNPEPNFYILGGKSYGRRSDFLFAAGLDQIRELFTIIGDREDLNLYASMKNLLT